MASSSIVLGDVAPKRMSSMQELLLRPILSMNPNLLASMLLASLLSAHAARMLSITPLPLEARP